MRLAKLPLGPAVVLASLVGLVVVGCGSSTPGTPSTSGVQSSDSSPGGQQAPKVQDPLDPAKYIKQPCSVLTKQAVVSAGMPNPGDGEVGTKDTGQPECSWTGVEEATLLSISWPEVSGKGLGVTYERRDEFKYFEPVDVAGHPGVFEDPIYDRPKDSCDLVVAVNDQVIFLTQFKTRGNPPKSQVCAIAKKASELVIQNMKKGS